MAFRETDSSKMTVGSAWKHIYDHREDPNNQYGNPDYIIGEVEFSADRIRFGRAPDITYHYYNVNQFLARLVPLGNGTIKNMVSLRAGLSVLASCPDMKDELHSLLVELEI